jgi:uncharacterized membrane protein
MTIWGLTALDLGALAFFLVAWLGFAPYLRWRGRRAQVVASAMIDHRRAWMEALLKREVRIADTAIVGHIMSTAAFFASTTVIVIGALLGVLVNMGRGASTSSVSWLAISPPTPLEIKVVPDRRRCSQRLPELYVGDPTGEFRRSYDGRSAAAVND